MNIVNHFYIKQEELKNRDLSKIKVLDYYSLIQNSFKDKDELKEFVEENDGNYIKIPIEITAENKVETKADAICMIIASFIYTYCKNGHYVSVEKLLKYFIITEKKLIKAVEEAGDRYLLKIEKGETRYHIPFFRLHFDYKKYVEILKQARAEEKEEEIFWLRSILTDASFFIVLRIYL